MEVNLVDVLSSAVADNGTRLRVTAILTPPSSWSPLPQNVPRSQLPSPPPPALLDVQLYRSDSATVLVTAWKWPSPRSDDTGPPTDTAPQTGLCSYPLSFSATAATECMILVDDSSVDSAKRRQARSAEDVTLCGLLVVRADQDQPAGAECEAQAVKQLQVGARTLTTMDHL